MRRPRSRCIPGTRRLFGADVGRWAPGAIPKIRMPYPQHQPLTSPEGARRVPIRSEPGDAAPRRPDSQPTTRSYLTVEEVARLARCEHRSVRRAIRSGRLRAFRPVRKILIREDDALDRGASGAGPAQATATSAARATAGGRTG